MDEAERQRALEACAAESPLHHYLREPAEERAAWEREHLQQWPADLDRPSRLTPDLLDRKAPVRFDECDMTPERAAALRARAAARFDARRAAVPIIPRDRT